MLHSKTNRRPFERLSHKVVEGTRGGLEVVGSGGRDGTEAESAEEGEVRLTRGVEGLGQLEGQITPPWHCADDAAGGILGSEIVVGGTERAGEVVVYAEKPVQQIGMGKEREAGKNLGEVARAETVEEWGESKTLEIQPLAIMRAGEHQTEARDWVLERILAFR
ncbi:hypothetical protein FH972_005728 [Carpinus fangiana]|uniref:Uncharacterized protein n=1 Tax=Carpinus fangiana TaxID=176857 RepID=A0A5N6QQ48_9ROSI|nr:hypothetical protein FH972_005728 [Carpinus fangiana]